MTNRKLNEETVQIHSYLAITIIQEDIVLYFSIEVILSIFVNWTYVVYTYINYKEKKVP